MNALHLKDLADKTRRGLRGRIETGKSDSGNAHGYQTVHALGADGQLVHRAVAQSRGRDWTGRQSLGAIDDRRRPTTRHWFLEQRDICRRLIWNRLRHAYVASETALHAELAKIERETDRFVQVICDSVLGSKVKDPTTEPEARYTAKIPPIGMTETYRLIIPSHVSHEAAC